MDTRITRIPMKHKLALLKTLNAIALAALTFGISNSASATLYTYDVTAPTGSHNAGKVTDIVTTFNTITEKFTWSHAINDKGNGGQSDGFWLVVTDGPNPKTHAGEYAILYGDADAGKVTAYEYSGLNNGNSWNNPGNFLGSWNLNVARNSANTASTFSFNIDATTLNSTYTGHCSDVTNNCDNNGTEWNSTLWDGLAFGERMGYWFHPFINSSFSYNENGEITSFSQSQQGWYDKGNLRTTASVSEPATLALFGLALGLGFAARRRKS